MSTISAYESSKIAFTKVFVEHNHIENQVLKLSHNPNLGINSSEKETSWRLATDIQFLSILENKARAKYDTEFASQVLQHLSLALEKLDKQLKVETFYKKMFSPYTAQNLIALTLVKKFNIAELKNKGYTVAYNAVNTYLPLFLNSAIDSYTTSKVTWDESIFGYGSGTLTYEQVAKQKKHVMSNNGIKRFASSLNGYIITGGALGLYGALLSGGTATEYIHRGKIVDLGNLAIDMSVSGDTVIGHLNNIGGGRSDGGMVSTGYASWVARGLTQIATGTTFELYNPISMFMKEANYIKTGLLTVLRSKGYLPADFSDFNGNDASSTGETITSDKTVYMYELTWCGDQAMIDTIENHLATKHGVGVNNPIVIDSLLSDELNGLESNTHRVLAGLTGAMIKNLTFNYASQFNVTYPVDN